LVFEDVANVDGIDTHPQEAASNEEAQLRGGVVFEIEQVLQHDASGVK
jgi:hypothetical protein